MDASVTEPPHFLQEALAQSRGTASQPASERCAREGPSVHPSSRPSAEARARATTHTHAHTHTHTHYLSRSLSVLTHTHKRSSGSHGVRPGLHACRRLEQDRMILGHTTIQGPWIATENPTQ